MDRADVVILVSTAASQTGEYRAKSLAALQSVLSQARRRTIASSSSLST